MGKADQRARAARNARAQLIYRPGERVDVYYCPGCGEFLLTACDADATPPDTVGCVSTPGCTTHNVRSRDRPETTHAPAWQWYTPDTTMIATVRAQGGPLWDHVQAGGMLLRRRATATR